MKRSWAEARQVLSIALRGGSTLLLFEVLYKLLGFAVVLPALNALLRRAIRVSGLTFLGQQTLGQLLHSPAAVALLLAAGLLLGLYLLFEMVWQLCYCQAGWQRQRTAVWSLCGRAAVRTMRLFLPRNIGILLVLPLFALTAWPLAGGILPQVQLPEFITDFIWQSKALTAAYIALVALSCALLFFYLLGMPAMVLGEEHFFSSIKTSWRLLRGNMRRALGRILLTTVLFWLAAGALLAAAVGGLAAYTKLRYSGSAARYAFRSLYGSGASFVRMALPVFATVVLVAAVVAFYYRCMGAERPPYRRPRRRWYVLGRQAVAVLCSLLAVGLFGESEMAGYLPAPAGYDPYIVAHRAGSLFAPENTVAALDRAVADGADMAEIDVQQTADGALVILHDTSFARTAGVDRPVWAVTWEQVQRYDAGSYFGAEYAGEPVPSLPQMLKAAKGRIDLMIELKSTGHDRELVARTIAAIKDADMMRQCVLASMDLDLLRQVKELQPGLPTVYISALLVADRYDMQWIDAFSVETSMLTGEMVAAAHLEHKRVFAWTTNSEGTIQKAFSCGADGIITDNVPMAHYTQDLQGRDLLLDELTQWLFGK
ncbi:glycerophosphoryl diester phosphodiesterase membrane domain-containing protein [Neobittarella massiliensis]|uniref:Glycerophosphoryl diester phosphodiesterase membrane domain-containing protein n=1 Tax=Neobittarella massiliensis (ex Bilen et al. 2018) TaxID=2041842 RepID=A0A8J6LTH8_9FIRM|nr:glycerophosphoryl diester phosphodiesterase membrane domain-containing protein [Neobittarella massiliensis]